MSIQDRYLHTLVVKRLTETTGGAAETPGGADTTLVGDEPTGTLLIEVADTTGITAGDYLRVGDAGEEEIRQVASVLGAIVTLATPLTRDHDGGDQVREVDDAGTSLLDAYGQPVTGETTLATVPGLIQPRTAREVASVTSGGVSIGNHVGYLDPLTGLSTDCWIEKDGERFDVVSIADAGGVGHHLEVGLERIV